MNQPIVIPDSAIAIEISAKMRSCDISCGLGVSAPELGASPTGATAGRPSTGSGFGDNHIGSFWAPRSAVSLSGRPGLPQNLILGKESGEDWHAANRQPACAHRQPGNRHVLS